MRRINLEVAKSKTAHTMEEALAAQKEVGYPTMIRPSFTMGGVAAVSLTTKKNLWRFVSVVYIFHQLMNC
jgi:carbamoylphosphate synthase large subunit